jgi:hypothetical protein
MDYINKKTGQIAVEQGNGFMVMYDDMFGMLLPGRYVRGNPEWQPLPKINEEIKEILENKNTK